MIFPYLKGGLNALISCNVDGGEGRGDENKGGNFLESFGSSKFRSHGLLIEVEDFHGLYIRRGLKIFPNSDVRNFSKSHRLVGGELEIILSTTVYVHGKTLEFFPSPIAYI